MCNTLLHTIFKHAYQKLNISLKVEFLKGSIKYSGICALKQTLIVNFILTNFNFFNQF